MIVRNPIAEHKNTEQKILTITPKSLALNTVNCLTGMSSQMKNQRFQPFIVWMMEENFQFGMKRQTKLGKLMQHTQ